MLRFTISDVILSFILLTSSLSYAQLSGAYTIDSAAATSGTNYQTFTAAISALTSSGVSGSVTFSVKKGTYNEQISIPRITGASTTNTITFKGLGDISTITAAPPTNKYPVVSFSGASHIIFDSVGVKVTGSRGWAVHFTKEADSLVVQNCHLDAPKLAACYGIVASSSLTSTSASKNEAEYISILNNKIEGGQDGILIKGVTSPLTSPSRKVNYGTNIKIQGNTIIDWRSKGIDPSNNHNVDILNNTVSSSQNTATYAVRYWDAGDNSKIMGNKFYIKSNSTHTRVVALSMAPANGPAGDSAKPIIIANNFIHYDGTNTTTPTGLLLKNKGYVKVYHNTIRIKNQGANANCIWLDANNTRSLNGLEVKNNILYLDNSGSGQFFFGAANGASFKKMKIDHNNYYAPSNYFRIRIPNGVSGITNYTSLTAYKANTSGYGSGALNVNPSFRSATNLHVTSSGMNDSGTVISSITMDIDGDIRSTSRPDIGADEYTPGKIVCKGPNLVFNKCDTFTIKVGSSTYTTAGTYSDTLVGSGGCDSVITTIITAGTRTFGTDVRAVCDSLIWTNGVTYTSSNNTAKDTIVNKAGCDSVVTLNLTITKSSSSIDTQVACESFTWIDGKTYTVSNNSATYKLKNAAGCDSVITLKLTVSKNSIGVDRHTTCGPFKWINGKTYTQSINTETDTITNAAGCDSMVFLILMINKPTTSIDTHVACASYTWIDGKTYTSNNTTATDTLTNAGGCDSIVTLNLTIKSVLTTSDVQTACGDFTWINGITYTENNYSAKDTLTSSKGCDSIVTLLLTIVRLDTSTSTVGETIFSNATNVTYQWVDCNNNNALISGETNASFSPSKNGSYAVIVTQNSCVDTSACVNITNVGLKEFSTYRFKVFPNPSNGSFRIELGEINEVTSVEVLNLQGQTIYEIEASSKKIEVNLNQPAGSYLLRIKGIEYSITQRLLIQ